MQQELRLIGKTDTDLQLQPRKMDGAGGAPLSLHKKMAALQQPKDPMDSLHQCDSCFVSEALPTLPQCYTPGLLFPTQLGPGPPGVPPAHSPVDLIKGSTTSTLFDLERRSRASS